MQASQMAESLAADAVSVQFDGLRALSDVTLEIPKGVVVGLIGPNGAGKTTLVNVLTGFQPPSSGRVFLADRDISRCPPDALRRLGVARTFQGGRLFKSLSVRENLEVTAAGLGHGRGFAAREADRVLAWMGLAHLADTPAAVLPYTDERRVAIARAAVLRPRFLLLDEPAAGMSEHEAAELSALIARIVAELGCGVVLIEHNVHMVLQSCQYIYVLDSGQVIEQGDPERIRHSETVRHAYMGTQQDLPAAVEVTIEGDLQ